MTVLTNDPTKPKRSLARVANRGLLAFSRHWVLVANLLRGLYAGLPWLAPVFMHLGWTSAGQVIYLAYSTQCHQLPQRSFFLYCPRPMHSMAEVQAVWQDTDNPLVLRQFVGNPQFGWKVAWSDRMVSMYTSIFVFGLLYAILRRRLRQLPLWASVLLLLPMALDGGTHLLSDLAGLGHGFRDSNAWLAVLAGNALPATFYVGDSFGSFNSWMRLITGILFGLGVVGFMYPYFNTAFANVIRP